MKKKKKKKEEEKETYYISCNQTTEIRNVSQHRATDMKKPKRKKKQVSWVAPIARDEARGV